MDETQVYIEMCEKAKEIQNRFTFKDGDFYVTRFEPYFKHYIVTTLCSACGPIRVGLKKFVWLPRQDQLQKMIVKHFDAKDVGDLHQYLNIFVDWFNAKHGDYRIREVKTYEQLWLAFVMHEEFQKTWNPDKEEWVKE